MATAIGTYSTLAAVKARLGITNSTDDTLLSTLCDQINQHIETVAHRVLAPVASAIHLFDGDGSRSIWVPQGVRAVTLLEIAANTGATFETIPASDYFLRPLAHDRTAPDWPATMIVMTDQPSATNSYSDFPCGMANVRVTMTAGWTAIPDDLVRLGQNAVVGAWQARQSGQSDVIGSDEYGRPIVARFLSLQDWKTLQAYSVGVPNY